MRGTITSNTVVRSAGTVVKTSSQTTPNRPPPAPSSGFADSDGLTHFWIRSNFRKTEERAIGFAFANPVALFTVEDGLIRRINPHRIEILNMKGLQRVQYGESRRRSHKES